MEDTGKTALFEEMPVQKAVMTLSIPTVLSSLVMVIYNLADTYFVGMLNDPVQNAAVTLAAPVLLAFNAVNNLFGVGTSSMMSRALGSRDHGLVRRSSAFGFYCTLVAGVLFSLLYTIFHNPLLHVLGADAETVAAEMDGVIRSGSRDLKCGHGVYGKVGGCLPACQYRNYERVSAEHHSGSFLCAAHGIEYGCCRGRTGDDAFQLCRLRLFFLFIMEEKRRYLCVHQTVHVPAGQAGGHGRVRSRYSGCHSEPAERDRHDGPQQFHGVLRFRRGCGDGDRAESQYGTYAGRFWSVPGHYAADQL